MRSHKSKYIKRSVPFIKSRIERVMDFMLKYVPVSSRILDLGTASDMSNLMKENGYAVINTNGENLDKEYNHLSNLDVDTVSAFQIFEHMLAPYNILNTLQYDYLIASVPLRVWFRGAWKDNLDPWGRHYHEFEVWQFQMLLERTGWDIIKSEIWKIPVSLTLGPRFWLRFITPTYYIVYCQKIKR